MDSIDRLLKKYPDLAEIESAVRAAFISLEACYSAGNKVMICGNGGSAADSEHIVGELMKGYLLKRPLPPEMRTRFSQLFPDRGQYLADHLQGALPTISLVSQISLITAFANDVAADMIFAQQVYGYGRKGDVLLGISTSGSSANIINALQVARVLNLSTIGLTGKLRGVMDEVCNVVIHVPWETTPEIQERHVAVYHALCAELEERFFSI
jgi:D-sedoheptulose 7-phosphate isomerase